MEDEDERKQQAVVYLRIAWAYPDNATAIEHQRAGCLRIAAERGLTVIREYVDVGRPALLEQQIELQRLLDELDQRRDASFVIVWNYARLGYSMAQLDEVVARIQACEAEVTTITGVETVERFTSTQESPEGNTP
jgi:DNA invertase Pin-like site-specific DNA recombinase